MESVFDKFDLDRSGTIEPDDLKALLRDLKPSFTVSGLDAFCTWALETHGKNGKIIYKDLVGALGLDSTALGSEQVQPQSVEANKLRAELQDARQELDAIRSLAKRQPFTFTVGQYNILAGYMGSNMEPWFLYGVDMPEERRAQIFKMFSQRGPDGKPVNAGWPNYVKGILTEEEIKAVEQIHATAFAWECRKDRLLEVIYQMDADILSLVECDYYESHFKAALNAKGYDCVWKKRPRNASKDGSCIAWRRGLFDLVAQESVEYCDKLDLQTGKSQKDRIALMTLLRTRLTGQIICFVSTHLQRNPEDPKQDHLRARQVGQVIRTLASFAVANDALDAPVLFAGDLNCTSFEKLRGLANVVSLLNEDTVLHPFSFDCADVPTGVTSVTTARCMRIDAIMYQAHMLELVDVQDVPDLSMENPIPNAEHPSDHIPVVAQFRIRNSLHMAKEAAKDWYFSVVGQQGSLLLDATHLKKAFKFFDYDGSSKCSQEDLRKVIRSLFGSFPKEGEEMIKLFPDGLNLRSFVQAYHKAVSDAGLPGLEDFKAAFAAFDSNSDGTIELDELLSVFTNCSPAQADQEKLKELFKAVDASGDGRIDLDELLRYLSKAWVDRFDAETRCSTGRFCLQ
jgi:Ca2+-binding EF-hand superfamily protein/mRNA deadenylase 3'-5' endonuclease subunit Ccr4